MKGFFFFFFGNVRGGIVIPIHAMMRSSSTGMF